MAFNVTLYRNPNDGNKLLGKFPNGDKALVESGGDAALNWSASGVTDGNTVVFNTDGTHDFGTKPNSAKPLLFWRADDGVLPDSVLGRKADWDDGGAFNGELSTAITAPNSTQAVRLDHSVDNSGSILGAIDFDSSQLYEFRRRYDDFGVDTNVILRTRFINLVGTVSIGDTITGDTSNFTNTVREIQDNGDGTGWVYYTYDSLIFTTKLPKPAPNAYISHENMTCSSGATMENDEGSGQLIDFNNKHFRLWGVKTDGTGRRDGYSCYVGQDTGSGLTNAKIAQEGTGIGGSYGADSWPNPLRQTPYQWHEDEFAWQDNTGLDTDDGILSWWEDGIKGWETERFNFRNATYPNPYKRVHQRQVSNGCKPLSYAYYDQLYIDDSWCRVVVSDSATLNLDTTAGTSYTIQPLPPTEWNSTQISCVILGNITGKYYHIINNSGLRVAGGQFV